MTQLITNNLIAQVCDEIKEERKPKKVYKEIPDVSEDVIKVSRKAWGHEHATMHWNAYFEPEDPRPLEYVKQKRIAELNVYEKGYAVPWAFDPHTKSLCLSHVVDAKPGGTVNMLVVRVKEGYIVGDGVLVTEAS